MRTHTIGPRLALGLLLIAASLSACIEPTEFGLPPSQKQLVVEGRLLSDTLLTTARLSFAQQVDDPARPVTIADAQVSVQLEGGALYALPFDALSGDYRSLSVPRVVGGRYQLRVQLADGRRYESAYETLLPPPTLSPMRFEFSRRVVSVPPGYYTITPVVESSFDVTQPIVLQSDEPEYYYIETTGIWEGFTLLGDPPMPPCCDRCWAFDRPISPRVALADDALAAGSEVETLIAIVPNSYPSRYQVLSRVMRISRGVHSYFREIRTLQDLGGNLFDPLPAQPRGNMRAANESDAAPLGVFLVGGARLNQFVINRRPFSQPNLPLNRLFPPNIDCREIYLNSVVVRPPTFPPD